MLDRKLLCDAIEETKQRYKNQIDFVNGLKSIDMDHTAFLKREKAQTVWLVLMDLKNEILNGLYDS